MRGNRLYKRLDSVAGQAAILALAPFSRRAPEVPASGVSRILVIKLAALGDTVLLEPSFRALRERYPGAEIGMVGTAINEEIAGLLSASIDRFYRLDVGRAVKSPLYLLRFVRELAAGGWQVGIDFDQWTRVTPLLLRLAGVPLRIGFRTRLRGRDLLYTHTRVRRVERHEAENFLSLLEPLGIRHPAPQPRLPLNPALAMAAGARLRASGWNGTDPVITLHPGCGHAHARAWPAERYAELARRAAAAYPAFFLLTGIGSERRLVEPIAAAIPPRRALILDRMSVAEFLGYLSHADVVVSGNTGAMHLAAALRRPQIVLEGPNDPGKWGALNPYAEIIRSTCPGCPCLDMGWEFHRTDGFCMEQIGVEEVYSRLAALLKRSAAKEATAS